MKSKGHRFLSMETSSIFKKQILILVLGTFLLCLQYQPSIAGERSPFHFSPPVKVMTQNLYFGVDIQRVLEAESPAKIPMIVAQVFQTLLQTDFPARAKAMADEIAHQKPDLIGLQEVALYRTQSPSDFYPDPNAKIVLFDYLQILLDELKARHLDYVVAAVLDDTDVELPMYDPSSSNYLTDLRLTDHDVILVRSDVDTSDPVSRNYTINLELNIGGIPVVFKRGYVAVDAKVGGKTYRFGNTHLEQREAGPIQALQAQELIAVLAQEKLPIILVGDLNSSPKDPIVTNSPYGTIVPPYKQLRIAGYSDVWKSRLFGRSDPGYTCCQAEALDNMDSQLYERVDHIFVLNNPKSWPVSIVGLVVADIVGEKHKDQTPSGLWPSDHAGVVARMLIPTFK